MRCVKCGRTLNAAAISITTKAGPLVFGPKCARKAGLIERTERRPRAVTPATTTEDPAQMQLELTQ